MVNGIEQPVDPDGSDPHFYTNIEPGVDDDVIAGTSSGFYAHLTIRDARPEDAGIYMTKITLTKYTLDTPVGYSKDDLRANADTNIHPYNPALITIDAGVSVGYVYHYLTVSEKLPCPFVNSQQNSVGPLITEATNTYTPFEVVAQGPFKFSKKSYGQQARFRVSKIQFDIKTNAPGPRPANQIDGNLLGVPPGTNFQVMVLTPNATYSDYSSNGRTNGPGQVQLVVKQKQSLQVSMRPGANEVYIREEAGQGPLLVGYDDFVAFSYTTCYWDINEQTDADHPKYQVSIEN